jgi:ABC-type amino acid transport substrate-binding protein
MFRNCSTLAAFALVAVLAAAADAQAPTGWTQVGMLNCKLNPSIGFIIAGHQSMECRFTQNVPSPPQAYEGALNTVGLDIGITAGGVLGWAVLAPTTGAPAGALAGEYVGASGDIGLGLGVGANVLVGGSGRTFALQPISVEGTAGVNVALGVSALKLRPVF